MQLERIRHFDPLFLAVCSGALSVLFTVMPLPLPILSFILNYFGAVPLYLLGFVVNFPYLVIASLVSFVLFTVGLGIMPALIFALTTLLPALLFIYRSKLRDSLSQVISWLTGYMLLAFTGILLVFSLKSIDMANFLLNWGTAFVQSAGLQKIDARIFSLLPAISSLCWIIMGLLNALAAQKLALKINPTIVPFPSLYTIPIYQNWDIIMAFAALLIVTQVPLSVFAGKNIALLCCLPLYLAGLNVIYNWLKKLKNPQFWMMGSVFLSFLLVWPGIFIVILGILEPTLKFQPNRLIK